MSKRNVLLQALASTPADLRLLLSSVTEEEMSWRASARMWSANDVVNHLAMAEKAYLARLQKIVAEDRPTVPYIHPDEAAHDATATKGELLARFGAARDETLAFLSGLSPGQWQRVAFHPTLGETTLRYFVQHLVEHDIEHTNQLVETIQSRQTQSRAVGAPKT